MKHYIFKKLMLLMVVLTAFITAASCAKMTQSEKTRPGPGTQMRFLLSTGDIPTKTVNAGFKTLWEEGDMVTLIHCRSYDDNYSSTSVKALEYTATKAANAGGNVFTATICDICEMNNWYFVYPQDDRYVNPSSILFEVPEIQYQEGNNDTSHLAGKTFLLAGKETWLPAGKTPEIRMRNILSRLDFNITNTTDSDIVIRKLTFSVTTPLTGNFRLDMTSDDFPVHSYGNTFNEVTVNVSNPAYIVPGNSASFHAGVVPAKLDKGTTGTVKVTYSNSGENLLKQYIKQYEFKERIKFKGGEYSTCNLEIR